MPLLLVDLDNTLIDRDGAFRSAVAVFLSDHELPDADVAGVMNVDASGYTAGDVVASALADRYRTAVPATAIFSTAAAPSMPDWPTPPRTPCSRPATTVGHA